MPLATLFICGSGGWIVIVACWIAFGYEVHVKAFGVEFVIYFVTNLEGGKGDARTYDGMAIGWIGAVVVGHYLYILLHYALYGSSPTCMNGRYDFVRLVIYKDGDAVGCRYAYASVGKVGTHRIYAFETLCPYGWRKGEKVVVYDECACVVCLVRHYEVVVADAELTAED